MTVLENDHSDPPSAPAQNLGSDGVAVQGVRFNAAFVGRCLTAVIAVVVIGGALANYAVYHVAPYPDHPLADLLKRFDLGHEPSIPAFYSATVMLMSAAFLLFLGRFDPTGGASRRRCWYGLSFLFLGMAIDETVMFHEMGTALMDGLSLGGPFYFSWVLPGSCFVVCVGLIFARFLMALNKRTRNRLLLSGVVFVAGAIGMELIAGWIFSNAASEEDAVRSVSHVVAQAVEEGLEMTGVAIFLCALIEYAQCTGIRLDVRHSIPPNTTSQT